MTPGRPRWLPSRVWVWLTRPDLGRCPRHRPEPVIPGGPGLCLTCGIVE